MSFRSTPKLIMKNIILCVIFLTLQRKTELEVAAAQTPNSRAQSLAQQHPPSQYPNEAFAYFYKVAHSAAAAKLQEMKKWEALKAESISKNQEILDEAHLEQQLEQLLRHIRLGHPSLKDTNIVDKHITNCIEKLWEGSTITRYGSSSYGLYVPGVSDIDIIIERTGKVDIAEVTEDLRKLKICLDSSLGSKLESSEVIICSHPILKLNYSGEIGNLKGLWVDISFRLPDFRGDLVKKIAIDTMKRGVGEELLLLLKTYLHHHELNQPYNGTLGGYALVLMVRFLFMSPHVQEYIIHMYVFISEFHFLKQILYLTKNRI